MMNKISYKNKTKIVEESDNKYVYKIKKCEKKDLYQYLTNKNFLNFLPLEESTNQYEKYRYIHDKCINKEDKAIDLINVLISLHVKTTTYQETNLDTIKELYETTKEKINYLRSYYLDLQDYIETKIYMSPAEQLLMNNISKFYKALNYAAQKMDSWYFIKEKQKQERVVQLHNSLALDHFLIEENQYLINWDESKKGIPIFDFLIFYKNEYQILEMNSLFELYQSKYPFYKEELLLFQALISIPEKITFEKTNYINTINTKQVVTYIDKTNAFLSKYNEKNENANHKEFEE